ncbi:nucleotidyl transferase AbiEii/AbiGii toxin family protein [Capnocytophaga canimorsus]|nr:nucleotidyl transferase AbiEii/AbiGii toxin family protein [Capnocytophaga canimorsus]WGU71120.1 nucleotidyl transferase AbiEii/AbiGii toxin family protein [Capnocytophaga canimorsus]
MAEEFYPKLKAKFSEIGISEDVSFELEEVQSSDQDPRIIHIFYPSIVETKGYINPKVQIEIGCRSLKEPFTQRKISSFVDEMYRHLDFTEDSFLVSSVNPERTFFGENIFASRRVSKAEGKNESG